MSLVGTGWTRRKFVSRVMGTGVGSGILSAVRPLRMLAQAAQSVADKGAALTHYLSSWPVPPRTSVPEWARPGKIRFAKWDGGALEVAKAILSGWSKFSPVQPEYVDSMAGWYSPRTIEFLRQAHINTIWVTFSNGFSDETERQQQEELRGYIAECHRYGIRTVAYESVTNMFFEDMFAHVPESKNWLSYDKEGKPVAYGVSAAAKKTDNDYANYTQVGHVSRYLADLSNAEWRNYLKGRIDLAIAAGADGVMYDNCFGKDLLEVFEEIIAYALSKKKDFLVMANFHREQYVYNRMLNAITTEEGSEPGVFTAEEVKTANSRWLQANTTMVALEGGFLVNNLGRMRVLANLSEGWKSFMMEYHVPARPGMTEIHIFSADHQQLILAENLAFNSAYEPSVEIEFAQGLWSRHLEADAAWKAIAAYNAFGMENERYYVGAQPQAGIAIVLDNRTSKMEILNGLAGRNLQYEILYEEQLTPERLNHYRVVAALDAIMVRRSALVALQEFVHGGGRLFLGDAFATQDETGAPATPPSWIDSEVEAGRVVRWKPVPTVAEMALQLAGAEPASLVQVMAPPQILYSVTVQPAENRLLVHLLNYQPHSPNKCTIDIRGAHAHCSVISPDPKLPKMRMIEKDERHSRLELEAVDIYSVVIVDSHVPQPAPFKHS